MIAHSGFALPSHVLPGKKPPSVPMPTTTKPWGVVASPNAAAAGTNELSGVAALAANDVWAVGNSTPTTNWPAGPVSTLIEHWDGTNWQIVTSPNPEAGYNILYGVAAVNANDVWAVGASDPNLPSANAYSSSTLIEHWDGTSWQVVPSPNAEAMNFLWKVAAVNANDIWAVGFSSSTLGSVHTLIEHWDGGSWQIVTSPNSEAENYLFGIAVISANDIWVVGESDSGILNQPAPSHTLIEHWDGTSWQIVKSPSPSPMWNSLMGVVAVSAKDIWAVGTSSATGAQGDGSTLIEHWNGKTWRVVPSPNPGWSNNFLYGVAAVSATNVWAVGGYQSSDPSTPTLTFYDTYQTLVVHWNGKTWRVVPSESPVNNSGLPAVAHVPGTKQLWAVGLSITPSGIDQTLTEFSG